MAITEDMISPSVREITRRLTHVEEVRDTELSGQLRVIRERLADVNVRILAIEQSIRRERIAAIPPALHHEPMDVAPQPRPVRSHVAEQVRTIAALHGCLPSSVYDTLKDSPRFQPIRAAKQRPIIDCRGVIDWLAECDARYPQFATRYSAIVNRIPLEALLAE